VPAQVAVGDDAAEPPGGIDHDGAREIVAWLDGAWRITDEIVRTQ
jgi:hypothetical protein